MTETTIPELVLTLMEANARDAAWVSEQIRAFDEKTIGDLAQMFADLYDDLSDIPYDLRSARVQDLITAHRGARSLAALHGAKVYQSGGLA